MAKIGMGDISPDLFALPLADFLNSFTDEFKRVLLPDMSDKQIEKELTAFYKKNGTKTTGKESESATVGDTADTGESAECASR